MGKKNEGDIPEYCGAFVGKMDLLPNYFCANRVFCSNWDRHSCVFVTLKDFLPGTEKKFGNKFPNLSQTVN